MWTHFCFFYFRLGTLLGEEFSLLWIWHCPGLGTSRVLAYLVVERLWKGSHFQSLQSLYEPKQKKIRDSENWRQHLHAFVQKLYKRRLYRIPPFSLRFEHRYNYKANAGQNTCAAHNRRSYRIWLWPLHTCAQMPNSRCFTSPTRPIFTRYPSIHHHLQLGYLILRLTAVSEQQFLCLFWTIFSLDRPPSSWQTH
jgi:hypothetical protein